VLAFSSSQNDTEVWLQYPVRRQKNRNQGIGSSVGREAEQHEPGGRGVLPYIYIYTHTYI